MTQITTLDQAIDLALKNKDSGEIDADLKLTVEGETWDCYTISITHRDMLCYCKQGTATLLVDSYGDRHVAELYDWERDET